MKGICTTVRPQTALTAGLALTCSALAFGACDGDREPANAAMVVSRDSAGVQVIENRAPQWGDQPAWHMEPEPFLVIAHDEQDLETSPLDPASVHRLSDGRIVVADGLVAGLNKLLIFDAGGSFVRALGREGQGPCEFQQLWWSSPYRGDSIAAYDYASHALTVFDTDGNCGRTFRLPKARAAGPPHIPVFSEGADDVYSDGGVLVYPNGILDVAAGDDVPWFVHTLLRTDANGIVTDTLGTFKLMQSNWDGTNQRQRPYTPFAMKALNGTSLLYSSGAAFAYSTYDESGTLRQIVRLGIAPRELTANERQSYLEASTERVRIADFEGGEEAAARQRASLESVKWPTHKPAISAMLVDSLGYVWLSEYTNPILQDELPDTARVAWHIVSQEGQWLGTLHMGARFSPSRIYADAIYGRWKKLDGTSEIRGYKLRRLD